MATDMPLWYHGAISKKDCEELMGKKNKDGAYLIRDSETFQGAMCLCVYKKHVVYTYRLLKTLNGQYTLLTSGSGDELYFKSLDDLVQHYKRKKQGLVMHLRHSVKRKTALLIRATAQCHIQNQVQSPAQSPDQSQGPRPVPRPVPRADQRSDQSPSQSPPRRPAPTPDQREGQETRDLRSEQNQTPRGAEERRKRRTKTEYNIPGPVQPTEHDELDYENVPDYVEVEPS